MNERKQFDDGNYMYNLAEELFPICRSITGAGTRKTLYRLKEEFPDIDLKEVPTGTKVFDWVIPKEWNIEEAYIEDEQGKRIIDFKENNLHVVGYSCPVDLILPLSELQNHLYSLPEQPDWIPYVTSYYKERWGFCITHNQREQLQDGKYHVVVRSSLEQGNLTYGEILIPGESKAEIFLSTYVCHPSMANNELSGPVVLLRLAQWISSMKHRRYSYRLIFVPETIGAIAYLSANLDYMREHVIAGFNLTCVGDDRSVSYIPTRKGNTLADRVTLNVLKTHAPNYRAYSYLQRGSDERQYNAPGVDLPVCSICRSKYHEYPEYHTSADDMTLISPSGLQGAYNLYQKVILALEVNKRYKCKCLCEPQLGPRGLYPTESFKGSAAYVRGMMDFLAYADGEKDLIEISDIIGVSMDELVVIVEKLLKADLVENVGGVKDEL